MKKILLLLIALFCLVRPVTAGTPERLLSDIFAAGAEALQEADNQAAAAAGQSSVLKELKRQGKQYAKELGQTVVKEIKKDPDIEKTLSSVQLLCYGVTIYITLISLFIFAMLWRMNKILTSLKERE